MSSQRHQSIDGIQCCAPARTEIVDWAKFLEGRTRKESQSPIDSFYESQALIVRSATAIESASLAPEVLDLVAGQLFLAYVSATELYLRQMIASIVRICPLVRRLNTDQILSFGAVDYYGIEEIEFALTEQVTFTESGKIRSQLKTRLGLDVRSRSSLERAISDFETVSHLRHALVHSHGRMNSRNAAQFLGAATGADSRTRFNSQNLDDAASVSVNLVREVNLEVARHVLWTWIREGVLTTDRRKSRAKIVKLINILGSQRDAKQGLATFSATDVTDSVMAIIRQTTR